MRTLFLAFSLMLAINAFAEDANTPEPTPDGRGNIVKIYPEDASRYKAQVWVVAGSGITCSTKDPKVVSDTFELTEKTMSIVPATAALNCYSKGGASMGVALMGDQNKSYTSSISNISLSSVEVLPKNPSRVRGMIQAMSASPVYCGYECPITPATGFYLTHPAIIDFRGTDPVCCATAGGTASIIVSSEVSQ